jgi:hypothetical protein
MIPTQKGNDILVVPLSNKYHQVRTILPGNGQRGVVPPQYPKGEIDQVPIRPEVNQKEKRGKGFVRPKAINPGAFMKGGGYLHD